MDPRDNSEAPRPAIVLVSGGLDSAVALACARRDGLRAWALSFDYGQRHRHELGAAALVAASLGAFRHTVLKIDLTAIGGSALTAPIDVPKDRSGASIQLGIPATYVPARNLTFLSCAAGLAEVAGARDIYIGVNAVDYSGYPDCRAEFICAFERAANLGTKAGVEASGEPWLRVRTPLVSLTKAQIIQLGVELGVDFSQTHSCYDPVVTGSTVLACGRCDSCQIRARGFSEAGVADPTRYAPQ